jgi:hypothetical protein
MSKRWLAVGSRPATSGDAAGFSYESANQQGISPPASSSARFAGTARRASPPSNVTRALATGKRPRRRPAEPKPRCPPRLAAAQTDAAVDCVACRSPRLRRRRGSRFRRPSAGRALDGPRACRPCAAFVEMDARGFRNSYSNCRSGTVKAPLSSQLLDGRPSFHEPGNRSSPVLAAC